MSILFVGNGINQFEKLAPDWSALINRVKKKLNISADFYSSEQELSMTMGFERFVLNAMRADAGLKELAVKKQICSLLERTGVPDDWEENHHIHRWLLEQDITDVLTTNYDYFLEQAADPLFSPATNTAEAVYSMKRRQDVNVNGRRKRIWHIHGELKRPASVCLGYDQYMGSVQRIRSYLTGSVPHGFRLKQILEGFGNKDAEQYWCHLFFTQDVHIIGFGLDFSEADIWWLLNYRAKLRICGDLPIRNHIYFYDTDTSPSAYRREMLTSFGVDYLHLSEAEYANRYARIKELLIKRFSKA